MAIDRLARGRTKEKECARAMREVALIRAWWIPPRNKYGAIADNTGQDVFGVFDFLAIDPNGAICGVQVCRKRPGEISIRKSKIALFCRDYQPAVRPFVCHYSKIGFILEELQVDGTWLIRAGLPYPGGE